MNYTGLEKKLIHTPTSANAQYSNQMGQFDNSSMNDQQRFSQNQLHNQQQIYNQQPQQQQNYYVNQNNNRAVGLQQQQIKQSQNLNSAGQFIQSNSMNDQQQTPLSTTTTHLLSNTTHQPVQPTSGSNALSSQYLNNKATGLLPNISNTSVNDSNKTNNNFVMNSNQIPMMNRNQQLSSPSCSYYSSERISSSSNNLNESGSLAISSSTNGNFFHFFKEFFFFEKVFYFLSYCIV